MHRFCFLALRWYFLALKSRGSRRNLLDITTSRRCCRLTNLKCTSNSKRRSCENILRKSSENCIYLAKIKNLKFSISQWFTAKFYSTFSDLAWQNWQDVLPTTTKKSKSICIRMILLFKDILICKIFDEIQFKFAMDKSNFHCDFENCFLSSSNY